MIVPGYKGRSCGSSGVKDNSRGPWWAAIGPAFGRPQPRDKLELIACRDQAAKLRWGTKVQFVRRSVDTDAGPVPAEALALPEQYS